MSNACVTRLAPSPTGALHLGNARTFLVNWALARRFGWRIVLRIEDLDGPRVKAGAVESAIDTLRWLGMDWDDGPIIQSADLSPYVAAMHALASRGLVYPSDLSRAEIEASASAPQEGGPAESRFPAELRPARDTFPAEFDQPERGWRFAVPDEEVTFDDGFAGPQRHSPSETVGDFVVWTKRGQPSYQLAVVVDDIRHGVTDVVRGDDLLDSTARQLLLYRALGHDYTPRWTHLPLVVGQDGKRLAKRHGDTRVSNYRETGTVPERVIGLLAAWCGLAARPRAMSAPEFKDAFSLATMPHERTVFTAEHHAWLMNA
ncbi:MAG: glutamate--tRNA ligase family protein [Phycisphaerales bacterium]